MKLLRMTGRILALSVQREMAHRTNLAFGLLMTVVNTAAGVAALTVVFTRTESLAGWSLGETLVLLGAYHMVSGFLESCVEPNLAWFTQKVTNGQLDDLLLQPVSSLFMASLGSCRPLSLLQVGLGAALCAGGLAHLGSTVTLGGVLAALVLLCAGSVAAWAARVLLASLAFWAPGLDATVLYFAFWQLGRYPVSIYQQTVRQVLTYVVPVALIATIPAGALTRGADLPLLAAGLGAALGAGLLARGVWQAGLKRYTGATS